MHIMSGYERKILDRGRRRMTEQLSHVRDRNCLSLTCISRCGLFFGTVTMELTMRAKAGGRSKVYLSTITLGNLNPRAIWYALSNEISEK